MAAQRATLVAMLVLTHTTKAGEGAEIIRQDICDRETLTAQCNNDEVIVMQTAIYGRMELGKCIKTDVVMGCHADILHVMDIMCSGSRQCVFKVDMKDRTLAEVASCPLDVLSYMSVQYRCRKVLSMTHSCSTAVKLPTSASINTLSSHVTDQTGCGSSRAPWLIEGAAGQIINFTLLDFGWTNTTNQHQGGHGHRCETLGYIIESILGINKTICGGKTRNTALYESASSSVQVIILPQNDRRSTTNFLLDYAVTGCPDLIAPEKAWYRREGNTATVGCEWGETTWQLTCKGNTWSGTVGNCSEPVELVTAATDNSALPLSQVFTIALIVGLGVLAGVLLCIIITGYFCVKRRRRIARGLTNQTTHKYGSSGEEHSMSLRYHPVRPDGSLHLPPDLNNRQTWCVNPIPMDAHHGLKDKPTEPTLQPEVMASMPHYSTACRPHSMPPALPQKASGGRHDNDLPPPLPPKQSSRPAGHRDSGEDYYWAGSHKYFVLDKDDRN